jgi:hypothetical protein
MMERPTVELPERVIEEAVLETFRRADPERPAPDPELLQGCCETLRSGGCLVVWPKGMPES